MAFVSRPQTPKPEKQIVTMYFGDVLGVDFRSDNPASYRSPDSANMYRSRMGYWESHPGFRRVGYIGKDVPVYGVHKFSYRDIYNDVKTKVLIHAGSKMYIWDNYPSDFTPDTVTEIFSGMANNRTKFLEFMNVLLVHDGEALYYYDGDVFDYVAHKAYVPKIYIGKSPSAQYGEEFQQRNYLSKFVIEGFVPEKGSNDQWVKKYKLSALSIDADTVEIWIDHNGKQYYYTEVPAGQRESETEVDAWDDTFYKVFSVDRAKGEVTFKTGPEYEIPGQENLYIKYAKSFAGYESMINECTEMIAFDDRVFLTGNPKHPNVVFWSGNEDWTYYGDLNYNDKGGSSSAKMMALQLLQDNRFLSIKEDTHQDGSYTVWSQASLNNDYLAETYLASPSHSTIGCVSEFAHRVFMDDNVFLSNNGLNAISRNLSISNERNIEHRSTFVDPRLLAEELSTAIMEQHRGYLYILFPNGHCYVANSATKTNEASNTIEYEWSYLEGLQLEHGDIIYKPVQLKSFNDKELYIMFDNGYVCRFYFDIESADGTYPAWAYSYDERPLREYVDTPFSWFGMQNRFKKLNRRYNDLYCVINSHADVEVLFHTEKKFMEESKVLSYKADVFTFNDIDFTSTDEGKVKYNFSFNTIPPASFVLKKLKGKRFRRLQLRIRSGAVNKPIIFKSLVVEAYVLTRKLK